MEFKYDERKRETNLEKHGVDLLLGALIFEGVTIEAPDERRAYGEKRVVAIGLVDGECFVTVYVQRGDAIRLISTRKGGRRDRQKYQEALARGD